jgi:nucleoid-associated protein YgaU
MTTGTKIFLAVFTVFIGVLIFYYGVIAPGDQVTPPLSVSTATGEGVGEATASDPPPPAASIQEPLAYSPPPPGLPSQSVESPVAGDGLASDRLPLVPLVNMTDPQQDDDSTPSGPESMLVVDPAAAANPGQRSPATDSPTDKPLAISAIRSMQQPTLGPTPAKTSPPPRTVDYTVKNGDTMASIAAQWFGDANKWSLIAKANPWVDPSRMQIGQKLQLPPKDTKPDSIKPTAEPLGGGKSDRATYIVRSGDTLAKIAREYYGNVARWKDIYNANKAAIGNDPADLIPGTRLVLPPKTGSAPSKPKSG